MEKSSGQSSVLLMILSTPIVLKRLARHMPMA